MIGIILFVMLGYSVMSNSKPFHIAAVFAVINSLISFAFGGSVSAFLIGTALLFVYASICYYILDNYGDGIFAGLSILLVGGLGLFFIPLMFIS